MGAMKRVGWNALDAVKKCWWNNKEIECNGLFANAVTDNGACFEFFPVVPTDTAYKSKS